MLLWPNPSVERADQFTVAQYRNPIGDLIDLIQKMGDENNPDAFALQLSHHIKE